MKFSLINSPAFSRAALTSFALGLAFNACGSRGSMNVDSDVSQVAAPRGSFLELCRQSTAAA